MTTTTHTFEADIQKLLHILIRSVYSNRDVFLRELISNASDAIDKVRVLKVTAGEDTKGEYEIRVCVKENTLEITDNGIGMDDVDLHKNLSTIAHSGTNEFAHNLKSNKDMSQFIGQFGVGFYSCFLISSEVEVITRKYGSDKTWRWTSDGVSSYSIEEFHGDWDGDMNHGTSIRLKLKDDSMEYGKEGDLKRIIQQHSRFISYPIKLLVEKEREEEKEKMESIEEEDDNGESEQDVVVEEENDNSSEKEEKKEIVKVKYHEWEQINGAKPLWYKEPSEITEEEYKELFVSMKSSHNPMDEVLYWKHFKAEGKNEFQGIFYFSRKPTVDNFNPQNLPEKNIRLYVKKVMIMENCGKELIPDWMCFVSGIVDSNDLALNVSREMLQNNHLVRNMKSYMTKQVVKMLTEFMEKDRQKYALFYENNGKFLKWAVTEKETKMMDFLMWETNLSENGERVSLDEYVDKFVENQKQIFYITGDDKEEMKDSVFLERFNERNIPVLYFTEPIDEFLIQHVRKHKEYDLVDVGKEFTTNIFDDLKGDGKELEKVTTTDLFTKKNKKVDGKKEEDEGEQKEKGTETENEETEGEEDEKKTFLEFILETLQKSNVDQVEQSLRLKSTPAVLVSKKYGWTGHMEKIMKSQPLQDKTFIMMSKMPKIWEVNLEHGLMKDLREKYETETMSKEEVAKRIQVLYKITAMQSGYTLEDSTGFCKDLFEML
jgi:molecular chaperone HtpG